METNEISMYMDAKLDIHGKRPESLKFKTWTRCLVKIEAIKCLPSFLRISLSRCIAVDTNVVEQQQDVVSADQVDAQLSVSINVPGVSVSQTESRTKQHSYGIFWKQNRRDCYIYFAIETEASCRRHMKWIRKSIKNLELHRQIFLEQRRNSRGPGRGLVGECQQDEQDAQIFEDVNAQERYQNLLPNALGPLPQIPDGFDGNISAWSARRVSRVSEIYEEIFEQGGDLQQQPPRLSRRYSRTSIASGIYEEMKPTTANFNSIVEEIADAAAAAPPPLPPLPPPRKRINTYETNSAGLLGEIPRSNTNPESELAKKKKYKNVLDNIFGSVNIPVRSKRAESVSENAACSIDDLVREVSKDVALYSNGATVNGASKRPKKSTTKCSKSASKLSQSKRNSFSSPDLSKINFLDTFDEERVAALLQNSFNNSDDLCLSSCSSDSLDESSIHPLVGGKSMDQLLESIEKPKTAESLESLNISAQIPLNFNFSAACNSSSINLVGASGANLLQTVQKNKILIDDLTGYCVMAPIIKKTNPVDVGAQARCSQSAQSTASSGYSTGSYCSTGSSASSCTNSTEDNLAEHMCEQVTLRKKTVPIEAEQSAIYENMLCHSLNSSGAANTTNLGNAANDFTSNLYENLLSVKATQELTRSSTAAMSPATTAPGPPLPPAKMSTSTPTGADIPTTAIVSLAAEEEEDYYQTPRKSIISVDDKVPSYYPNSCDTNKMRRRSHSPTKGNGGTPTTSLTTEKSSAIGLRQLVSAKLRRERKENYYISSPQKILEQRSNDAATSSKTKNSKTKKTAAHKISEHMYAVSHNGKNKTQNHNNNNINHVNNNAPTSLHNAEALQEKLQSELLQLAALQNIDFKFDDSTKSSEKIIAQRTEEETENCYQAKQSATRILHKYATLARSSSSASSSPVAVSSSRASPQRSLTQHHLQQSQQANTQSDINVVDVDVVAGTNAVDLHLGSGAVGMKKFASLPRFKKIDFSPLKLKINNVLQRNQQQQEL